MTTSDWWQSAMLHMTHIFLRLPPFGREDLIAMKWKYTLGTYDTFTW